MHTPNKHLLRDLFTTPTASYERNVVKDIFGYESYELDDVTRDGRLPKIPRPLRDRYAWSAIASHVGHHPAISKMRSAMTVAMRSHHSPDGSGCIAR